MSLREVFHSTFGWVLVSGVPLTGCVLVLLFIYILTPVAHRHGLLDSPDHRKKHSTDVPLVGGLAIFFSILVGLVFSDSDEIMLWLILSGGILLLVGALDDAINLGIRIRLVAQCSATIVMIEGGSFWIRSLGLDWGGLTWLPNWLGIAITLFAVVGLTNGLNMVDGIDGLAAGQVLVALISISLTLQLLHGSVHNSHLLIFFGSAVLGFILVNLSITPLRPVFLGDAGSLLLGFLLAWVLIFYSQPPLSLIEPVAVLWCVTIPVFDTLFVIIRRLCAKKSPFSSDRSHMHYLLVDIGVSHRIVLTLILVSSLMLNLLGIWITYIFTPLLSLACYAVFFGLFSLFMGHRASQLNSPRSDKGCSQ